MIFLDGAYRLHRSQDVAAFTQLATDAFPEFASRIECFGADWLGRQFATDRGRLVAGFPQVLMLEPGTGEVLDIPCDRQEFHEEELLHEPDAAAAYSFFKQWLAAGGAAPSYDECVGYRRPLYLGGTDDLANLEMIDFDVYWTISAQLLSKFRGMAPGTKIQGISISD